MPPIPRYRAQESQTFLATFLSAGFRPFFLSAALWAAVGLPLSIAYFEMAAEVPTRFSPSIWHPHEMAFGFGGAVVAGFLLTAIPNWTRRMPLQGAPLAGLVALWLLGRIAVFFSASAPAPVAAVLDLAFPAAFFVVVAREIVTGRNWRNLPMVVALALLFVGNMLTHLDAMDVAETGALGVRLDIATLVMLVALVGGRITPSFTRNWLVRALPGPPACPPLSARSTASRSRRRSWRSSTGWRSRTPRRPLFFKSQLAPLLLRLARWRGARTGAEPLLFVLHLGYGWLALGLLFMGVNKLFPLTDATTSLHTLTAGAIGTMTLAVMTRATRGHTGRPLVADRGTVAIYIAVTLAAALRVGAPFTGEYYFVALAVAAGLWSLAYGLFVLLYFGMLTGPRARADA